MESQKEARQPAPNNKRRSFGKIALEIFSIVLGVLLALGLSEWQERRNNEERAALALTNVRAELQSNFELLEFILPNNSRIVESIRSGQESEEEDSTVIPGVQMRSSAWQTLYSTGLSNFVDYEVLIELSQLYSMIDVYRQTAYRFISSNMTLSAMATAMGSEVDNERFSQNFLSYFQMLVQIETVLLEGHQRAIQTIDQESLLAEK